MDSKQNLGIVFVLLCFLVFAPTEAAPRNNKNKKFPHSKHLPGFAKLHIACTDCHSFSVKSGEDLPTANRVQKGYLLKSARENCDLCHRPRVNNDSLGLCISCHETRHLPGQHIPDKIVGCLGCHQPRGFEHKSLAVENPAKSCTRCHDQQGIHHPKTSQLLQTDRAKQVQFEKGKISCLTCHEAHPKTERTHKLLRKSEGVIEFCASCHAEKAVPLYERFHEKVRKN